MAIPERPVTTTCVYCGCTPEDRCEIKLPAYRDRKARVTECRRMTHADGTELAVCTTPACVRAFHMGIDPAEVEERTPEQVEMIERYSVEDAFDLGVDILSEDERFLRDAARVRGIIRGRRL